MNSSSVVLRTWRMRSSAVRVSAAVGVVSLAAVAFGMAAWPSFALTSGPTTFRLQSVGRADNPVGIVRRAGDSQIYVVEKGGTVQVLRPAGDGRVVLDVSADVSSGNEQGLLGAAFSVDGSRLYVNLTNNDGDTEIREYQWSSSTNTADATTKRLVLEIKQPFSNHNGGDLAVDSRDRLWIAVGDGGGGGDPERAGQDLNQLLGKILRIDPTPSGDRAYSIPADNPFADGVGGRAEIWAWGLRNPWRFEVDEPGNRVVIADVGQNEIEEVNVVALSARAPNFGWNLREGSRAYNEGAKPDGSIDPVFEATHSSGWCSVTGGVTYRGSTLPTLRGTHIFGDYCQGQLMSLRQRSGGTWVGGRIGVKVNQPSAFGTDANGAVLVASLQDDRVYRLVGR
jgi:glucose/arabinose dehydrogenase